MADDPIDTTNRKKLVLLRLRRRLDDGTEVYVVIEATDYGNHEPGEDPFGHDQSYYDEHTCPTNWLGVAAIIEKTAAHDVDEDPHGVFEWVRTVYPPEDYDTLGRFHGWSKIFPEVDDGVTACAIAGTADQSRPRA